MGHDHSIPGGGQSHHRAFAIGIILNVIFVGVEAVYGIIADSSALLADAGHNASDVLSLIFAWTAAWLAGKQARKKYTYGYRRSTILASLLNALLLFAAVILIGREAFFKLLDPQPVAGDTVMIVAGIGVLINTGTALLFLRGQKDDLNIRGAFLHMAADAAVSLGVVIAGLAITKTGYYLIDPLITFLIIGVIIWSTWRLFTESVNLALDAVPRDIDLSEVRAFLEAQPGVENVHDLHIWAMSTTQNAITAHLVMPGGYADDFLFRLRDELLKKFNIGHATFQVERHLNNKKCLADCGDF